MLEPVSATEAGADPKTPKVHQIAVLNILFGWTRLGWIYAMQRARGRFLR